jgi:uncharacterized OB-fold protein
MTMAHYLPEGLPIPISDQNGLSAPFWAGLRAEKLMLQKCHHCASWQWGPEWICHQCHSFDLVWCEVEPRGQIYSWERVWHATHPTLKNVTPYLVVLVEITVGKNIRMIGNLLGEPQQDVAIGREVTGVFEHHNDADPPFTLLQWRAT